MRSSFVVLCRMLTHAWRADASAYRVSIRLREQINQPCGVCLNMCLRDQMPETKSCGSLHKSYHVLETE